MESKSSVFIIKSSPWRYWHLYRNHPEYSAIFDLIKHYRSKFRFILVGSSNSLTKSFQLDQNIIAWDIKSANLGQFTYHLELLKLLFQYRPNVVIVLGLLNTLPVAIYSLFTPKSKYIPIFIGEFGYYGSRRTREFLYNMGIKALGISLNLSQKKIATAFALSKYTQQGVQSLAPSLKGKIRLISYPIHQKFDFKQDHPASGPYNEPTLLTVAGIEPRKGLDTLIKAISLVPKKFQVIIKGAVRDVDYMQRLNNMVNDLNLKEKISIITNELDYDSLVSYYKSATLFVLPTKEDCLGVVILEALHCGTPTIATSVGGIPDMIEDGVNGILIRPNDPQELAAAISLVLENDTLRKKLAANARSTLISRYYRSRICLKDALIQSLANI